MKTSSLISCAGVLALFSALAGCASAPAVASHQTVSTLAPVLQHEHVPPSDFVMTIADDSAPKPPQMGASEPTKLRPMSLTRRNGE